MGEDYLSWLYGTNNSMLNINRTPGVQISAPSVSTKFRNPINQNIGPSYTITPQTSKGVTDLNPEAKGKAVGAESGTPWGMIASIAAANVGGFFDGINPSIYSSDLLQQAGSSNGTINGVGYQIQNNVNADRIRSEYDKNNFSKIWSGNIGGFIGGLFGRSKVNREIEKAQREANNITNFNRDIAATTGMQMDFSKKYGNLESQLLYAKHGKDMLPGFISGKDQNWFNNIMTTLKSGTLDQNAWVSKGEGIYDPETGNAKYVPFGKNDTAPAHLKPQDVVFGDLINPHTGRMFKKDAEQYIIAKENLDKKRPNTDDKQTLSIYEKVSRPISDVLNAKLTDLAETQHEVMQYNDYINTMKAKHGKDSLPRMASGKIGSWWPNAIISGLGLGASIAQYFDAKNQRPYRPYTYIENPYENRALTGLQELRINPYNMMQQLRNVAGRANYAVNTAGALSGSQKMLQKTAIAANTQNNIANALQNIAEKNIGLQTNAYDALLTEGARGSQNRMRQIMYDIDTYMKSHGARQKAMWEDGVAGAIKQAQQYGAMEYKRRMGNAMIDLYSDDLRSRRV